MNKWRLCVCVALNLNSSPNSCPLLGCCHELLPQHSVPRPLCTRPHPFVCRVAGWETIRWGILFSQNANLRWGGVQDWDLSCLSWPAVCWLAKEAFIIILFASPRSAVKLLNPNKCWFNTTVNLLWPPSDSLGWLGGYQHHLHHCCFLQPLQVQ